MPDYRDHFTFCDIAGGIHLNSLDYGVYVLNIKEDNLGERNYEAVPIQGRSGDLLLDYGNYNNIGLTITVAILNDAEKNIYALNAALLSMVGYCRLEHSYDLDNYRIGYYVGGAEPRVSRRGDLSVAELKFNCKPQKFLKIGEKEKRIEAGTSSSSMIVAEGRMKDVMRSGFTFNVVPEEFVTVLHVGDNWDDINLYYPSDMYGRIIQRGATTGDPTGSTAVYGTGGDGIVDSGVMNKSSLGFTSNPYLYFSTPLMWEVLDANGNVIDSTFSNRTSINSITKFPASPIIKIHTKANTDVGGRAVMRINDGLIRLSHPEVVREGSQRYNVEDIYIDCDTMNAYMYLDEDKQVVYNMNRYVSLPNKSIKLHGNFSEIWTNDLIDYADIVPRWWTR